MERQTVVEESPLGLSPQMRAKQATVGNLEDAIDIVLDVMAAFKKEHVDPLHAEIALLRGRVNELESTRQMKYHGVWSGVESYPKNAVVSHRGSMWIAIQDGTTARPDFDQGAGVRQWTLIVKAGRDGKSAA